MITAHPHFNSQWPKFWFTRFGEESKGLETWEVMELKPWFNSANIQHPTKFDQDFDHQQPFQRLAHL